MISYRPWAPLDRFVERIWWNDRARPSTDCEHHLPSGRAQLVIALHDEPIAWSTRPGADSQEWTGGIVHGPQSSYYVAGPKPRGAVLGVSFRPGMVGPALGVPPFELADRHVGIGALWGTSAGRLRERLAEAATPEAALALLEAELVNRLPPSSSVHPAIDRALRSCDLALPYTRVGTIQRETGYSAKHFVSLFRSSVGITPKQYLRIARFGSLVRHLAAGGGGTLADLAAEHGYADQSHLTREFRELAGTTPTAYRPPGPASAHHHVVPGDVRVADVVRNLQDGAVRRR